MQEMMMNQEVVFGDINKVTLLVEGEVLVEAEEVGVFPHV